MPLGFRDEFFIDVTLTLTRFPLLLFFNKLSLLFCDVNTGILDGLTRAPFDDCGGGGVDGVLIFRIGIGISDV